MINCYAKKWFTNYYYITDNYKRLPDLHNVFRYTAKASYVVIII